MTATHPGNDLGRHLFEMSDGREDYWRAQQYYGHQQNPTILTSQWLNTGQPDLPQMMGMQDIDLRMFENDDSLEIDSYSNDTNLPLVPLALDHHYDPNRQLSVGRETSISSDLHFPTVLDNPGFGIVHDIDTIRQYQPSNQRVIIQAAAHSRHSSQSVVVPEPFSHTPAPQSNIEQRPILSRSITAPEQRQYHSLTADHNLAPRSGSEEGDNDSIPQEEIKMRGRKRQRIPHTAVERRYRENLNAHLDDLRLLIPTFNRRPAGQTKPGEHGDNGIKPSKCEVLKGAMEYIMMLEKENALLKDEVKTCKKKSGHTPHSNTHR
nr:hypothetical protein CFP56_28685 [Quercus suber]